MEDFWIYSFDVFPAWCDMCVCETQMNKNGRRKGERVRKVKAEEGALWDRLSVQDEGRERKLQSHLMHSVALLFALYKQLLRIWCHFCLLEKHALSGVNRHLLLQHTHTHTQTRTPLQRWAQTCFCLVVRHNPALE